MHHLFVMNKGNDLLHSSPLIRRAHCHGTPYDFFCENICGIKKYHYICRVKRAGRFHDYPYPLDQISVKRSILVIEIANFKPSRRKAIDAPSLIISGILEYIQL